MTKKYIVRSIIFMFLACIVLTISFVKPLNMLGFVDDWLFLSQGFTLQLIASALGLVSGIFAFLSLFEFAQTAKGKRKYFFVCLIIAVVAGIFTALLLNKEYIIAHETLWLLVKPLVTFSSIFLISCIRFPYSYLLVFLLTLRYRDPTEIKDFVKKVKSKFRNRNLK